MNKRLLTLFRILYYFWMLLYTKPKPPNRKAAIVLKVEPV
jgi:hypothetical protein